MYLLQVHVVIFIKQTDTDNSCFYMDIKRKISLLWNTKIFTNNNFIL